MVGSLEDSLPSPTWMTVMPYTRLVSQSLLSHCYRWDHVREWTVSLCSPRRAPMTSLAQPFPVAPATFPAAPLLTPLKPTLQPHSNPCLPEWSAYVHALRLVVILSRLLKCHSPCPIGWVNCSSPVFHCILYTSSYILGSGVVGLPDYFSKEWYSRSRKFDIHLCIFTSPAIWLTLKKMFNKLQGKWCVQMHSSKRDWDTSPCSWYNESFYSTLGAFKNDSQKKTDDLFRIYFSSLSFGKVMGMTWKWKGKGSIQRFRRVLHQDKQR